MRDMKDGSIVVMEGGAGWPSWVDEEAGNSSSVVVLARHRGETAEDFAARARSRLGSLAELRAPRRGVLVCGTAEGRDAPPSRERLLRVLCEVVGRSGGDEVVLIGDDARLIHRLSGFVRELNHGSGTDGPRLSLRMRSAPVSGEEALRVA
jgi:hypothetical protein